MRLPDGVYDDARVRKLAEAFRSACRELGVDPDRGDPDEREKIARAVLAAESETGSCIDGFDIASRAASRFRSARDAGAGPQGRPRS